jgi:hypothetical protein
LALEFSTVLKILGALAAFRHFSAGRDARLYGRVFPDGQGRPPLQLLALAVARWTIACSCATLFAREPRNACRGTAAVPQVSGNILPCPASYSYPAAPEREIIRPEMKSSDTIPAFTGLFRDKK